LYTAVSAEKSIHKLFHLAAAAAAAALRLLIQLLYI
jgi:hypothetical protein